MPRRWRRSRETSSACRSNIGDRCAVRVRSTDVLLPEIARVVGDLETRLEELEQEDAIWMSRAAFASGGRNGP
jgi:hypothetical protein